MDSVFYYNLFSWFVFSSLLSLFKGEADVDWHGGQLYAATNLPSIIKWGFNEKYLMQ